MAARAATEGEGWLAADACLTLEVRAAIERVVEVAYPEEGCGLVTVVAQGVRVHAGVNLLARGAARADEGPRYLLEPRLLVDVERRGERVMVVFHSHPDGGPRFSEADAAAALLDWGDGPEPTLPGVDHLVVSVVQGQAGRSRLYRFQSGKRRFQEIACFDRVGRDARDAQVALPG